MPNKRVAELQLRTRAGTLQGRVCWPGSRLARAPRLLVFFAVADCADWCRELSSEARLVVLSATPAGLDDAITAAEWAAENAARLGAQPGQLLIGGAGHGGTLAAAAAWHAHARGWPAFRRQVLVCASPAERTLPSLGGLPPVTAVTVEHDPAGDAGRYAAALRAAGVVVDEIRYAAADQAHAARVRTSPGLLAELGSALRSADEDELPGRKEVS